MLALEHCAAAEIVIQVICSYLPKHCPYKQQKENIAYMNMTTLEQVSFSCIMLKRPPSPHEEKVGGWVES